MKNKIIILLLLVGGWLNLFCQQIPTPRHEIVFVTQPGFLYKGWLESVVSNWYATGICIQLYWGDFEKVPGKYDLTVLNNSVNAIVDYNSFHPSAKLDIYIRVNFGVGKPSWVNPTDPNMSGGIQDFQIKSDGSIYDYYTDYLIPNKIKPNSTDSGRRYPLNFASANSKKKMLNVYNAVLDFILKFPAETQSLIKEVSPTFSHYEETEYPVHKMCGYSLPEINSFIQYLKTKFTDTSAGLAKLNKQWNPDNAWPAISSWKSIDPKKYNWDRNSNRTYEPGRVDWIDFRATQLANFLEEFAELNATHRTDAKLGFPKFGVQFGSIYDNAIENRGWIDPSKIIEVADVVHVADIPHYVNNFNFSADYLRSICKFFTHLTPDRPRTFTTESNGIEIANYKEGLTDLCRKWSTQLDAYDKKGADAHFICDWYYDIQTLIDLKKSLSVWNNKLSAYRKSTTEFPLPGANNNKAVHLSCEYFLWNSNSSYDEYPTFPIQKLIMAEDAYLNQAAYSWNDDGMKDIITNYMIEQYPEYLADYTSTEPAGINFTKTSQFITEKAYWELMKFPFPNIKFANQTVWMNGARKEIKFAQGIRNEYNNLRSPIQLLSLFQFSDLK